MIDLITSVFIVRGIFNPVAEEALFRGFLLGVFSFVIVELVRKSRGNAIADFCYFVFLAFWSLIFMLAHNDYKLYSTSRGFQGQCFTARCTFCRKEIWLCRWWRILLIT